MDAVKWEVVDAPGQTGDLPYATHAGVLVIGDCKMRCYRLNTGQAIIHADDMHAFFEDLLR